MTIPYLYTNQTALMLQVKQDLMRHGVSIRTDLPELQAERKLEAEIVEVHTILAEVLPWYKEATFVTKTVLIGMAISFGIRGLLSLRSVLAAMKAQSYTSAAQNMRLSLWYKKKVSFSKELTQRMAKQTIEPQHKAKESIQ